MLLGPQYLEPVLKLVVTKKTSPAAIPERLGKSPSPESDVASTGAIVSLPAARLSSPNKIKRKHALLNHTPANSIPS